jgi:hypothetical protein
VVTDIFEAMRGRSADSQPAGRASCVVARSGAVGALSRKRRVDATWPRERETNSREK